MDNKRYIPSVDFSYLGHLLIYLYYSSFTKTSKKSKPWYDELKLSMGEINFLKKLLRIDNPYRSIYEVKKDFIRLKSVYEY